MKVSEPATSVQCRGVQRAGARWDVPSLRKSTVLGKPLEGLEVAYSTLGDIALSHLADDMEGCQMGPRARKGPAARADYGGSSSDPADLSLLEVSVLGKVLWEFMASLVGESHGRPLRF